MTGNSVATSGKIWLSQYSPGVPAEIDLNTYQSVVDILEDACNRFRNLPAYECMGFGLTYDELDKLSGLEPASPEFNVTRT